MVGLNVSAVPGRKFRGQAEVRVFAPKVPERFGPCSGFGTNSLIVWIKTDVSMQVRKDLFDVRVDRVVFHNEWILSGCIAH